LWRAPISAPQPPNHWIKIPQNPGTGTIRKRATPRKGNCLLPKIYNFRAVFLMWFSALPNKTEILPNRHFWGKGKYEKQEI